MFAGEGGGEGPPGKVLAHPSGPAVHHTRGPLQGNILLVTPFVCMHLYISYYISISSTTSMTITYSFMFCCVRFNDMLQQIHATCPIDLSRFYVLYFFVLTMSNRFK